MKAAPLLLAAVLVAPALHAQADSSPPGEWVDGAAAVAAARAFSTCPLLPWREPRETMSDSLVSRTCTVEDSGSLGSGAGTRWRFARYRHVSVYAPDAQTLPADRDLFPDTLPEDELVLFALGPADSVRPVWHDLVNTRYSLPQRPRVAHRAGTDLLVLEYCVNGTGGCWNEVYRLTPVPPWRLVRQAFAPQFRARLPGGWGTWKGFSLSVDSLTATAPAYVTGDANCCPSYRATLQVALQGDSLTLIAVRFEPDTIDLDRRTFIPGYRAGGIGPNTSLASLERWFSPGQLAARSLELGEGICTPGTVVRAGTEGEMEIAWADSAQTQVAFVRVSHRPSSWRTVQGVTIGTTLDSLVRIAGHAVEFSGWGWDYGGGMTWTEPVPAGFGSAVGAFRITLAPDSAGNERLHTVLGADPRAQELWGEQSVPSDHPLLKGLTVEVTDLSQGFANPAIERDCERR